jgi:hypothetical protein
MVRVRILEARPSGPRTVRRNVKKANLGNYRRLKYRGQIVLARPTTIQRIRDATHPPPPSGKSLLPKPTPMGPVGAATEEFFVRDDYPGGGQKRDRRTGKAKGRHKSLSLRIKIAVSGSQEERDRAFDRLEEMMGDQFPFLRYRGVMGRRTVADSPQRVRVREANINQERRPSMARALRMDLMEEIG